MLNKHLMRGVHHSCCLILTTPEETVKLIKASKIEISVAFRFFLPLRKAQHLNHLK